MSRQLNPARSAAAAFLLAAGAAADSRGPAALRATPLRSHASNTSIAQLRIPPRAGRIRSCASLVTLARLRSGVARAAVMLPTSHSP
jgi:hypothetical protein